MISYAALSTGTLAEVGRTEIRCKDDASGSYVQGFLESFTFEIDNAATSWYKGVSEAGIIGTASYDMQSVLLHEFGHTHLLRHVNQPTDVMWFDIADEQINRKLQPNDIEGGKWVMGLSGSILTGTNCSELSLYMENADVTGLPCSTLVSLNDLTIEDTFVEVYPNPFEGILNLQFRAANEEGSFSVNVVDVTGKIWWHSNAAISSGSVKEINLSAIPPGLYFLNIISQNGHRNSTKIIKH